MSKIFNIYGNNPHEMTKKLLEASNAVSLVPSNGNVALKPNLVISGKPENGATTHSGVLSGCIEYFQEHNVKNISIIEGSWIAADTARSMRVAGYDSVCEEYNVPFYDLKRDKTRDIDSPIGKISVCTRALDADLLVNLPVLKGHCQTVMTCALKNLKGCLPDREKRRFHSLGLTKPIAALGAILKPRLNIVDSICGDLNFEEGGNPVQTNRMYLGFDAVQIDAFGCNLMGLDLNQVKYVKLAEEYGAGFTQINPDDIVNLNEPFSVNENYSRPSGIVVSLVKNVKENSACSACYASLVRALYSSGKGKNLKIYIGQGWKNKSFDGLGIGNCCSGASRCVKGCPPSAADIIKQL